MKTNLLQETLEFLDENDKSPDDVVRVQCGDAECMWEEFVEIAVTMNYDQGFGSQEIASDLMIVGNVWWLERHEYDGSEWWEYKEHPDAPLFPRPMTRKDLYKEDET